MSERTPAWRSWLELMRLSNGPTVISNVLVGAAIAKEAGTGITIDSRSVLIAGVGALLLYVAGMILNDVFDAEHDRAHRPSKPIPSGRICPKRAAAWGGVALFTGASIPLFISTTAALVSISLAICIVAYNALHHRSVRATPLMGLCRALVYVLGWAAVSESIDWAALGPIAGCMLVYVTVVTLVARREASPSAIPMRRLCLLLPLLAATVVLLSATDETFGVALLAAVVPSLWAAMFIRSALALPPRMMIAIPAWLAGICLIDGAVLWVIGEAIFAALALGCFLLTVLGQRFILGT